MTEIEEKAYCNLYVSYFTLTEEMNNLVRYTQEIGGKFQILEISYNIGIILNKFLSVNTILYITFKNDLSVLYNEKIFEDTFESDLFQFVHYLRNFVVHQGFNKIRAVPKLGISFDTNCATIDLIRINVMKVQVEEFLQSEFTKSKASKGKGNDIQKALNYISKFDGTINISEVLKEYYDEVLKLYKIYEKKVGFRITYLKD